MSVRRVRAEGCGTVYNVLESCPACGHDFAGWERRCEHIAEHDPEDFGLSPHGEIPEDHAKPLFGGVGDGA
ncbi:hypothetical protein GCM10009039_34720 [Halocalculus aciditolerans]|uniref:C2H2-type domain-containing protein n=1 Tax=Halocalculus aciditolerans TaxID=1383812 RepID=A0A830FBP4_9EURY|nr:hypothetical protein GCM10009039_34720 [Halocalculus aciditolerans]